jgi:hypothetical protein
MPDYEQWFIILAETALWVELDRSASWTAGKLVAPFSYSGCIIPAVRAPVLPWDIQLVLSVEISGRPAVAMLRLIGRSDRWMP